MDAFDVHDRSGKQLDRTMDSGIVEKVKGIRLLQRSSVVTFKKDKKFNSTFHNIRKM